MSEFNRRISRGIAWTGVGAAGVAVLDLVTLVILFRHFVSVEELGVVTLAASLFPLLDVLVDLGLHAAITQADEADEERVSTAFWLNLGAAFALIALLAVLGPLLSAWQSAPAVQWLLLAYGGKLLLINAASMPTALMRRQLRFRDVAIARMLGSVADISAKILFAVLGAPIWSFVAGPLALVTVNAIVTQLFHPWRPRLVFRMDAARTFLRFGLRTSGSQILLLLYASLDYQVVGRFFGEAALGLYRVAYDLVLYAVKFVSDVIVHVAFPAFSRLRVQADPDALREHFLGFSRQSVALNLPVLVLVFVAAEEVLALLFPSYTGAAAAARIFCLVGIFRALTMVFPPLFDGLGKPGATLRYAMLLMLLMPPLYVAFAVLLGERFGFLSVALAWLTGYPIAFVLVVYTGLSLAGLRAAAYIRGVGSIFVCGAAAVGAGLGVRQLLPHLSPVLTILVAGGAALLVLALLLIRWQGFTRSRRA